MNVLKQATKEKLAEYLNMRKNQKIKSPNVAVSGLTGDGNVRTTPPVKSAVVDRKNSGMFVFKGTPEEIAKKKEELKKRLGRNAGFSGSSEAPKNEGYGFLKAF